MNANTTVTYGSPPIKSLNSNWIFFYRQNGCEDVNLMMDNAKALTDFIRDPLKSPGMAMLRPKLYLVGSIPEGTRAGIIQEIDVMMELKGFRPCFLQKTNSATMLKLTTSGKMFFSKLQQLAAIKLKTMHTVSAIAHQCYLSSSFAGESRV